MNINNVIVSGNLTKEPELRQTANGKSVLQYSVAVNESRKNQSGGYDTKTNFVDCVQFGNVEGLAKTLHKGHRVVVSGKLNQQTWQAQDGSNRSKIEILVLNLDFVGNKGSQPQNQQTNQEVVSDSDIPF